MMPTGFDLGILNEIYLCLAFMPARFNPGMFHEYIGSFGLGIP